MRFSKYAHEVYQSIANFMYFQKNIRTMYSKPTENPPQGSIAPLGSCQRMKYECLHTGSCYISIGCKFCVLSEKWKNCMPKIHEWNWTSPQAENLSYDWLLDKFNLFSGVALSGLIYFIKETVRTSDTSPLFMLKDLNSIYEQVPAGHGVNKYIHSTGFKDCLLESIPGLCESRNGQNILL